jgi:hypothetical protein
MLFHLPLEHTRTTALLRRLTLYDARTPGLRSFVSSMLRSRHFAKQKEAEAKKGDSGGRMRPGGVSVSF